jgi:hypothetical protein
MIMKRIGWILVVIFLGINQKPRAQSYELARLILDIEKLSQLKNILSDLYKGYEILKTGYTTIKDISEGSFNLHKAFLDGLLAVSPLVQKYERVAEIIDLQSRVVREYKAAESRYRRGNFLNPDELNYIHQVYENLVDKSGKNIENLLSVLTAGKLRMDDAERLRAIDGIYLETKDQFLFLRQFNNSTDGLVINRSIQDGNVRTQRNLHGIN